MREIEVKYRVDDLEGLLAVLKARSIEVSDPLHQDDQAYAPAGWQFGDGKLGISFLRLRTVAGRHYFTLKQPAQNDQACLEYETEVTDREAMHNAVLHMGYRPTVRIIKTRRSSNPWEPRQPAPPKHMTPSCTRPRAPLPNSGSRWK
jgi:adenylate cyclase class 2